MPDTHAFIGTLARALATYEVQICLSTLGKMLHTKGALPYQDGFDIGSIVAAAYAYWVRQDAKTAAAIRYAFTGEHGERVIPANEPTHGAHESQEA
jgi:hypothetical protein